MGLIGSNPNAFLTRRLMLRIRLHRRVRGFLLDTNGLARTTDRSYGSGLYRERPALAERPMAITPFRPARAGVFVTLLGALPGDRPGLNCRSPLPVFVGKERSIWPCTVPACVGAAGGKGLNRNR